MSFVAAAATPPPPTPTPKKPTPPPAPTPAPAPETPKPATITIDNAVVDSTKPVEVHEDKPLVLSGKTVANGVVKLYIFSEPKTATVTADKDGNWTYSVTDLPPGDHHIESEVTDPATGRTSARASILAFTVKVAEKTAQTSSAPRQAASAGKSKLPLIIAGIVLLIAAASSGFWWWKKRSRVPKQPEASPPQPPETKTPRRAQVLLTRSMKLALAAYKAQFLQFLIHKD